MQDYDQNLEGIIFTRAKYICILFDSILYVQSDEYMN